VIEVKTSESMNVTRQPYKNHTNQILYYMAITNAPYGKIFYILIGHPELDNCFYEYLVKFNHENHREEILKKLEGWAAELAYAIDSRNPALAEHAANDRNYIGRLYRPVLKWC